MSDTLDTTPFTSEEAYLGGLDDGFALMERGARSFIESLRTDPKVPLAAFTSSIPLALDQAADRARAIAQRRSTHPHRSIPISSFDLMDSAARNAYRAGVEEAIGLACTAATHALTSAFQNTPDTGLVVRIPKAIHTARQTALSLAA